MLVLVQQPHSSFFRPANLFFHAIEDLLPQGLVSSVPVAALSGVVTEYADVRRAKDLAQFDGPLEPFQVRLERLVDLDLADGRTDGAEFEAVLVEERFQFAHLKVGQVKDVGLENGAQL